MSPEMQAAYIDACGPFIDGAIGPDTVKLKSWRYFLEVNSACNLRCPTCTKGNVEGYEHDNGFMDPNLMERILDKIKAENPAAIVFLYGNSEPFIHPRLPECIASIKRRGLNAQFSTNLNFVRRLDETIAAEPDMIIISLSGFTQEIYERGHAGGQIEKVKANMRLIAEANARLATPINISVNYHLYNDNEHELPPMRDYALSLGLGFFTSVARAISMENAIQYCRHMEAKEGECRIGDGKIWALPPLGQTYIDTMKRLRIPPSDARQMYAALPADKICPVGSGGMFTFIRHDGKTQLCPCTADRRITLADYLDATPDQLIESRDKHPLCAHCSHYKLRYYFHIVDRQKWT